MTEERSSEDEPAENIDTSMFSLSVLRFVEHGTGDQLQRFSSLSVSVPSVGEEVQLSELTIPESDENERSDEDNSDLYEIKGRYKVEEIQRDYTNVNLEAEDTNLDSPMVEIAVAVSEMEDSDDPELKENE